MSSYEAKVIFSSTYQSH